jgi:hypothetical protein
MSTSIGVVLQELHRRLPPGENKAHALYYSDNSVKLSVWYKDKQYPFILDNDEELNKRIALVDQIEALLKSRDPEKNNLHFEKITSNNQLIANHYYWVCSKGTNGPFFPAECRDDTEPNRKWLQVNNMNYWAYEGNSQALEIFEVFGPIPKPY